VTKYFITAGVALATYAAVAFVQKKVISIPFVGDYLPG
jgi:hypothetical protein